jgi:hypothetical protein
MTFFETPGLEEIIGVDYWGHYPIADTQFQTDAPVSVGVRAWAPFIPGDSKTSNTPGAIFEIHLQTPLRRSSRELWRSAFRALAITAAGTRSLGWTDLATTPVLPPPLVERRNAPEGLNGTWVEDKGWGMSYVLGVLDESSVRVGGAMGVDGSKWTKIVTALPPVAPESGDDGGSSLAVDFSLEPNSEKVVRIVLAWYAPEWEGNGNPGTGGKVIITRDLANYHDGQVDPKGGPGSTGKALHAHVRFPVCRCGEVASFSLATSCIFAEANHCLAVGNLQREDSSGIPGRHAGERVLLFWSMQHLGAGQGRRLAIGASRRMECLRWRRRPGPART